jgi:ABC-type polysaccharide/polyol phosphate export permease
VTDLTSLSTLSRQAVLLTHSFLKARYRRTFAGFVWVTLNPIIRFAAQILVFHLILNIPQEDYALFLVTGLLPWHFMSQSMEMCTHQLIDYARWIRSFPAHPSVYVIAQVLDCLVSQATAFALLFIVTSLYSPAPRWGLALLPLAAIPLVVFTVACSWLLATLQVFYRDTRFILALVLQVLFFITPIFFSQSMVPDSLKWIVVINPFHHMIEPFRHALFQPDLAKFGESFLTASAIAGVLSSISYFYGEFKRGDIVRTV